MLDIPARVAEAVSGSSARHLRIEVRCLIERRGDFWQAFTLEFGLAVQASSLREAKQKLDRVIQSYVYDALTGEDREHAEILLSRKATLNIFIRYHFYKLLSRVRANSDGPKEHKVYSEPLALEPKICST
jgi:hypothetical protein